MDISTHFNIGEKVYLVGEKVFVERVNGFVTCFMNSGKPVEVHSVSTMCVANSDDADAECIQREMYTFKGFHPMMMGVIFNDMCNIFRTREEAIIAFPELSMKLEEREILTREQITAAHTEDVASDGPREVNETSPADSTPGGENPPTGTLQ